MAYNADKGIEEQLSDLITDYKVYPEESLLKLLQREMILALVRKNPNLRDLF